MSKLKAWICPLGKCLRKFRWLLIQLGLTQRADGKPELALATWKQGVETGDIGALYWSAVVKYESGGAEEALKLLTRAAALTGPAHPLHQAVQQLLVLVESSRRSCAPGTSLRPRSGLQSGF